MISEFRKWLISFIAFFCISIMALNFSPVFAQSAPPPPPPPAENGNWLKDIYTDLTTPRTFEQRRQAAFNGLGGKNNCWSCYIFNEFSVMIFEKGKEIDAASKSLIPVITGFATVFALFYLGTGFVAGDASDLPQRWTVFWRLCIAAAAGSAVLKVGAFTFAWDYIYGPLFSIGTALASAFGATASGCSPGPSGVGPSGAADAIASMYGIVCGGHQMSVDGIALGIAVLSQTDGLLNSIIYAITGIIIAVIFLWIMISFPLRFIDVLMRMGIVGMITPLLVICAVFKPTRGYISIGISNILNASAQFAITAIMFSIGYKSFIRIIASSKLDAGASNNLWIANTSTVDTLSNAIMLVGMATIFGAMLKSVPSIAAEFSQFRGGGGDAVGNAASSTAATVMTAPIKGAALAVGLASGALALKGLAGKKGLGKGVSGSQEKGGSEG